MKYFFYLFIIVFSLVNTSLMSKELMILKLTYGEVEIELYPDKAPNHVKRFKELSNNGKYDGVVFHRVIEGFMAQTVDDIVNCSSQLQPLSCGTNSTGVETHEVYLGTCDEI